MMLRPLVTFIAKHVEHHLGSWILNQKHGVPSTFQIAFTDNNTPNGP